MDWNETLQALKQHCWASALALTGVTPRDGVILKVEQTPRGHHYTGRDQHPLLCRNHVWGNAISLIGHDRDHCMTVITAQASS
jgi:hypothetical protein